MSKAFRDFFTQQFLANKKNEPVTILAILAESKKRQPPGVYPDLIKAFVKAGTAESQSFRLRGRASFKELLWNSRHESTTISNEFAFARQWLQSESSKISEFRRFVQVIQASILGDNPKEAFELLVAHRKSYGWTVWGAELEFAVATIIMSEKEVQLYWASLTDNASPRIASLFGQIVKDRNDPAIKISSFIGKCEHSFPQLGLSAEIQQYLLYRSFGHIKSMRDTPSILLTAEMANSPIDYYETLVDICGTIVAENAPADIVDEVRSLTGDLLELGIDDFRLKKIHFAAGGSVPTFEAPAKNEIDSILCRLISLNQGVEEPTSSFVGQLVAKIDEVRELGPIADKSIDWLLKFGLNFRGLPIGSAVCGFAIKAANNSALDGVCSAWAQFASPTVRLEDAFCLGDAASWRMIQTLAALNSSEELAAGSRQLLEEFESTPAIVNLNVSPTRLIWVAYQLIKRREFSNAQIILQHLESLSSEWQRRGENLRIMIAVADGNFGEAIEHAAKLLVKNSLYASELPLNKLFHKTKWATYKEMDPVVVGVVSHWAFALTQDSNARYICRMACRAFKNNGLYQSILSQENQLKEQCTPEIVAFLHDVWVDENLNMAGYLSTQEVRQDRIKVLQLLLQMDESSAGDNYAQEIKELTFSETLWQGLKHIESSRVFVNEGAIARWAEKELASEFERWKSMVESDVYLIPSVDEVLRKYLLGDVEGLATTFHTGEMTAVDAVLMGVVDRLLDRFLLDPADGLNCYLSSRIRHGSLKGILLGPLEDAGLLGLTEREMETDWRVKMGGIDVDTLVHVVRHLKSFGVKINKIATKLVNETVQVRNAKAPGGMIYPDLTNEIKISTFSTMAKEMGFAAFVSNCFDVFWHSLTMSLGVLAGYIRGEIKDEIQREFDQLIDALRALGESTVTMTTALRTVATATQGQCDVIANWFQTGRELDKLVFPLDAAVEIAKASTGNVYRSFPVAVVVNRLPPEVIRLTSLGLSAITDCLYIMLVNSFKHSGLRSDIPFIEVVVDFFSESKVLKIAVSHPLSADRLKVLSAGGIEEIRRRYIENASIEHAPAEGGSGFAKLSRLIRMIDKSVFPEPISINLNEQGVLAVQVCIPIYARGDAYDAYFA
jgi:hypothetical protein